MDAIETTDTESEQSASEKSTKAEEKEDISNVCNLDNIKADVYELDENFVIVRVLRVKPVNKCIKATFHEQSMEIEFKTEDEKFLLQHGKDSDTTFVWHTQLAEKIVPQECNFKVTNAIELKLKKETSKIKWKTLTPPVVNDRSNNLCAGRANMRNYDVETDSDSDYDAKPSPTCDFYDKSGSSTNDISYVERKSIRKTIPPVVITPKGFTGLFNIGNSCFINASLQALLNTAELKEYFCQNFHYTDLNADNILGIKGKLAVAFGNFMQEIWSGNYRALEPTTIKLLIGRKASQFSNFAQHDAQEFLSFLLDLLHEDLNRITKKPVTEAIESDGRPDLLIAKLSWQNHKSRDDSIIIDLFHGLLKSRLHCPECSRVSITFDPFVFLPVPLPTPTNKTILRANLVEENGKPADEENDKYLTFQGDDKPRYSLFELLRLFTEPETLGPQEAWYCSKCKKHQEAEKTMLLWTLPSLLIIQLKRFCFTAQSVRRKIDTLVDYPIKDLDLKPYLSQEAPSQQTLYDLYAVVCHSGSAFFGHYISYARLMDLESGEDETGWRQFDDANVTNATEAEIVDGRAYLLFYKRRDVDSKQIFETYRNKKETIAAKKAEFERNKKYEIKSEL